MRPSRTRRNFLRLAAAVATGAVSAPAFALPLAPPRRALAFQNLHTGESLDLIYWAEGRYLPDATQRIEYLLRDFRNNKTHTIDPRLLDLLVALRTRLDTGAPFLVISGYRSPETNAMLHRTALDLKVGGVGYYPRSDFVHVDVGRVRRW